MQGIEVEKMRRRWASNEVSWPDGWLAQVQALAQRRGSAPATVAALSRIEQGTVEKPTTNSRGCHALTRTLPVALLGIQNGQDHWSEMAREIAALTHGDSAAHSATVCGVVLVQNCLTSILPVTDAFSLHRPEQDSAHVRGALETGIRALLADERGTLGDYPARLDKAFRQAVEGPASVDKLARLAPDRSAPSVLLGGLYVAACFPGPASIETSLRFAAGNPAADSVACVAGALLGAAHGIDALPVDLTSRLELSWVLDTLARDFVSELVDSPGGDEYTSAWDPNWWRRYPGG